MVNKMLAEKYEDYMKPLTNILNAILEELKEEVTLTFFKYNIALDKMNIQTE
jgi:hypothetical protein